MSFNLFLQDIWKSCRNASIPQCAVTTRLAFYAFGVGRSFTLVVFGQGAKMYVIFI
ncbi:hypothetical protein [Methanobrevibacter sp.]|uniref:hypothetical protein n=1 Tax=Methanobrevibacter sp. TaxID=66852 RepID=UPI00386CC7A4